MCAITLSPPIMLHARSHHPFPSSLASDPNPPAQELESLLEKGIISDSAFDTIHTLLPAESSLSGPTAPAPAPSANRNPTPAPAAHHTTTNTNPNPPPTYAQSTVSPPA